MIEQSYVILLRLDLQTLERFKNKKAVVTIL